MAQHEGTKAIASPNPQKLCSSWGQCPLPKARDGRGERGGKESWRGSHSCGCLWSVCEHLPALSSLRGWKLPISTSHPRSQLSQAIRMPKI